MQHDRKSPVRRVKVEKRTSIYYRVGRDGRRRYEITFLNEQGVRRWQVVDGNLEAAQAELDERRRRRRSGEAVSPEKLRLSVFAETWLATQTQLRPGTMQLYRIQLGSHVLPKLGRLYLSEIREDDVVSLIDEMREGWHYRKADDGRTVRVQRQGGYSAHTIKGALVPLGRILNSAVRRGHIPSNPMTRLERGERPSLQRRDMRVLGSKEIATLLGKADKKHGPLLATAIFTGLRLGELLGLTWADVDLDAGLIRVRKQLDRGGQRVAPKTTNAARGVELMPALGSLLRRQKERAFGLGRARPEDFVFCSRVGTPLQHRNVARRMLDPAMEAAKLVEDGQPRLRFHDLRHSFASLLIAQGHNVVFVSRQLGHSSTHVTLDVYGHLFDRAEHGQRMRDQLEATYGDLVGAADGDRWRREGQAGPSKVV